MSANHPLPAVRPLPPRPNLEFERKEARALLRRLRAGEPDALARARARHPALDAAHSGRIRLADAQLVLAREYGFTSWPRLMRWFEDVERQRHGWKGLHSGEQREALEGWVRTLVAEHGDRRRWAARALAAYVPRLYGLPIEAVFAATVTDDEARLAVARHHGFPSWAVLVEHADAAASRRQSQRAAVDPMRFAGLAIEAGDPDELRQVVEAHPELLHPPQDEADRGRRLLARVVHHERRKGIDAMRPIREWLESQGLDYQLELNRQLCGHRRMTAEKVRWLLDRGADPHWVAPNGVPVLEHALIRYWNGEAVDLVAARAAAPRDGLWVAAGLGDVAGVRQALDRDGRPTPSARRHRPPFDLVGPAGILSHPEPDDEELLMEAFFVAMLNGRTRVLEYMVSRGAPLNSLAWDQPLITLAVGNAWTPVVECLVRLGADPDLRGWRPQQSARELAREMVANAGADAEHRRIAELLGLDPEAILAERNARPAPTLTLHPSLEMATQFAGHDAFRLGQPDVRPENLLVGALRATDLDFLPLNGVRREDLDRYQAEVGARVRAIEERVERPKLPLHPDAQAVGDAMFSLAEERRHGLVTVAHLLYALARSDSGPVAELLARYGASAATVRERLERGL